MSQLETRRKRYIRRLVGESGVDKTMHDEIASEWEFHLSQMQRRLEFEGLSPDAALQQAISEFGCADELASHVTDWQLGRLRWKTVLCIPAFAWVLVFASFWLGILQIATVDRMEPVSAVSVVMAGLISFVSMYLLLVILRLAYLRSNLLGLRQSNRRLLLRQFVWTFSLTGVLTLVTKACQKWQLGPDNSPRFVDGLALPILLTIIILFVISAIPFVAASWNCRIQNRNPSSAI